MKRLILALSICVLGFGRLFGAEGINVDGGVDDQVIRSNQGLQVIVPLTATSGILLSGTVPTGVFTLVSGTEQSPVQLTSGALLGTASLTSGMVVSANGPFNAHVVSTSLLLSNSFLSSVQLTSGTQLSGAQLLGVHGTTLDAGTLASAVMLSGVTVTGAALQPQQGLIVQITLQNGDPLPNWLGVQLANSVQTSGAITSGTVGELNSGLLLSGTVVSSAEIVSSIFISAVLSSGTIQSGLLTSSTLDTGSQLLSGALLGVDELQVNSLVMNIPNIVVSGVLTSGLVVTGFVPPSTYVGTPVTGILHEGYAVTGVLQSSVISTGTVNSGRLTSGLITSGTAYLQNLDPSSVVSGNMHMTNAHNIAFAVSPGMAVTGVYPVRILLTDASGTTAAIDFNLNVLPYRIINITTNDDGTVEWSISPAHGTSSPSGNSDVFEYLFPEQDYELTPIKPGSSNT